MVDPPPSPMRTSTNQQQQEEEERHSGKLKTSSEFSSVLLNQSSSSDDSEYSSSSGGKDPHGTYGANSNDTEESGDEESTHGERLVPTRQDSYDDEEIVDHTTGREDGDSSSDSSSEDSGGAATDENDDYYEGESDLNSNVRSARFEKKSFESRGSRVSFDDSFMDEDNTIDNTGTLASTRNNNNGTSIRKFRPSIQEHSENDDAASALLSTIGLFRNMGMMVSARNIRESFRSSRNIQAMPLVQDDDEEDQAGGASDDSETGSPKKKGPKFSPFPSTGLLIALAVFIAVVVGVLIGCLTYYFWEKQRLDPIVPPGSGSDELPRIITIPDGDGTGGGYSQPLVPSDDRLMELFATVFPRAPNSTALLQNPNTAAGKAALWMLTEDEGKTNLALLPRSDQAWIQRYVLAFTYYATTTSNIDIHNDYDSTATSRWLSCNPPKDGNNDTCQFTYPTELPNGSIIYDLVPSHRWLSGVDECQWGGVACWKTVAENITTDPGDLKRPPTIREYYRSVVTSIVLADQNLEGSIVNELVQQLPYLEVLDLSHNGLEGSITEDYRDLTTLKLSHNRIEGEIPGTFFGDSSPLEEFDIGYNNMIGSIPDTIGLSPSLKHLSFAHNAFNGTIPALGNMPLVTFRGQNNLFDGFLPFDYGYGGSWPSTLEEWWVDNNKLNGPLPEGIGFLTSLQDFRVHHNRLTGRIPESIGQLDRLYRFEAHNNQLTGSIPESIGSLSSLQDVTVQFNGLTGAMPQELCFLETMVALEADCFFGEADAAQAREIAVMEKQAKQKAAAEQAREEAVANANQISKAENRNTDVIPIFSSLDEAVAAARAGGYTSSNSPANGSSGAASSSSSTSTSVSSSSKPFRYSEVQCYCCTKCCNPQNGECLRFSTNEITFSNSGLVDTNANTSNNLNSKMKKSEEEPLIKQSVTRNIVAHSISV